MKKGKLIGKISGIAPIFVTVGLILGKVANRAGKVANQTSVFSVFLSVVLALSSLLPGFLPGQAGLVSASSQTELIINGGFECGSTGWSVNGDFYADSRFSHPHSGTGYAYLSNADGTYGNNLGGTLEQTVTIPSSATSATFTFWYSVTTTEPGSTPYDLCDVIIFDTHYNWLGTAAMLDNTDSQSPISYSKASLDLTDYVGQTIKIVVEAITDVSYPTVFRLDDFSILATLNQPPTLISPLNNSHPACSVTFQWSSVPGATNYELSVKLPGSSSWASDETTATSYPYPPTLLGQYHWKARAYVDASWTDYSEEWIFYWDGLPAPNLVSLPNDSETTDLRPLFKWNPVSCSNYYRLQLARDSSFTNMVRDNLTIYGTSWQLDNQDLTSGQTYYWRVCSMNPIGLWSDVWHFTVIPINHAPSLSSGYVSPASGDTSTMFDYYVTYTDSDGDAPTTKYVYVDGSPKTMTKISGSYTSGATYKYSTTIPAGSHNYYFYFNDGHGHTVRLPTSGSYSGPNVSIPNQPPSLSSGYVSPASGDTSTMFDYYVTYTDSDGDAPTTKYVYVDGSPKTMTKISGSYTSGATYKYSTTIPAGSHNYYFYFNDGHGHTVRLPTSGSYSGPNVSIPNQLPTAYIDSITPNPATQGTHTVSFTGHGTDPDGFVIGYNWRSSKDGQLSTSSSFTKPASALSVGTHTIYFKVMDDDYDWSTEVTRTLTINPAPTPNQPPDPPAFLFQYELNGPEIPVGGRIFGDAVTLIGGVSDPDNDQVRLQVELRRHAEYDGSFTGIPTQESEFVDTGYGAMISIQGLIPGSYHWQGRTVDEAGAASDWVDFGNNDISETDFAVATEMVFKPPYQLSDRSGWSESFLLGEATYHSEVDPSVGYGKISAATTVSFGGYGEALAAFTLGDYWRSDWSGTANIAATFGLTGVIGWMRVSFPKSFTFVHLGVNLKASLWVYDHSDLKEIWRNDLTIYKEGPEWKLVTLPEADTALYDDTQYVIQGFVDLERNHTYSWHFEATISSRVDTGGYATAVAGGNFVKYGNVKPGNIELIDVRIGPPVPKPEPEPIVIGENVMYVAVGSPVDVLVVDPDGKRIGFDIASQQVVNEIPEASYSGRGTHPQLMIIPTPIAGNYEVLMFGADTGLYDMVAFTSNTTQETVSFMASEIPTTPGAVHQYTIDWDTLSLGEEGVTVHVDSDGDGVFEDEFTSDEELTQDEFTSQLQGCFIATAAYGTPMAEEIEILRIFRDEHLLTNPLGQTFVDFYYRVSPPIAEFITEHPSLKPIVRAGLLPAVVMSTIVVNTTPTEKAAIVGLLASVSVAMAIWVIKRRGRGLEYTEG